jgi:hypothetical protein
MAAPALTAENQQHRCLKFPFQSGAPFEIMHKYSADAAIAGPSREPPTRDAESRATV